MTLTIAIVLGLLVVATILFATELLTVDVVALGLVAALVGTGVLTPRSERRRLRGGRAERFGARPVCASTPAWG